VPVATRVVRNLGAIAAGTVQYMPAEFGTAAALDG